MFKNAHQVHKSEVDPDIDRNFMSCSGNLINSLLHVIVVIYSSQSTHNVSFKTRVSLLKAIQVPEYVPRNEVM